MIERTMLTAGVAAALGAICLHLYLARFEAEAVGGPPQALVALTRDISPGEVITRASLTLRAIPERYVEERHIAGSELERIVGARASTLLRGGSNLLWTDLDVMEAGRSLSSLVRTGMRAFSMPGGAASFDGLLRPGDRVDVLLTLSDEQPIRTATLLQNLLVLTVGSDLGSAEDAHGSTPRAGEGATLSVTPAQAEVLAKAEGQGRLRLSLRNPQDLVTDVLPSGIASAPESSTILELSHAR